MDSCRAISQPTGRNIWLKQPCCEWSAVGYTVSCWQPVSHVTRPTGLTCHLRLCRSCNPAASAAGRLQSSGCFLQWTRSSLTDRTQQVAYNGSLSAVLSEMFGVSQGSVLGLLLYVLNWATSWCVISSSYTSMLMTVKYTSVRQSTPLTSKQRSGDSESV